MYSFYYSIFISGILSFSFLNIHISTLGAAIQHFHLYRHGQKFYNYKSEKRFVIPVSDAGNIIRKIHTTIKFLTSVTRGGQNLLSQYKFSEKTFQEVEFSNGSAVISRMCQESRLEIGVLKYNVNYFQLYNGNW